MPSLSYLALRDGKAGGGELPLRQAARLPARQGAARTPARARRRARRRADRVAAAAAVRFPGDYEIVPVGVDPELFRPAEGAPDRRRVGAARTPARQGGDPDAPRAPGLADARPPHAAARRAPVPRELASRVSVRTLRAGEARAPADGQGRDLRPGRVRPRAPRVEAAAAGAAIADPDGVEAQPELAAAAMARLAEDDSYRARRAEAAASRRRPLLPRGGRAARRALRQPRHPPARRARDGDPLGDRPWILADLTCTPGGRTTARSRSSSSSTMPRRRVSARSPSPTTTSSAARSRRSSSRTTVT